MSDEEILEMIKSGEYGYEGDSQRVVEAVARIIIALKKKGIDAGVFLWWGDESWGMHNVNDNYKHLGKIADYQIRFSNEVINAPEEDGD